MIPVYYSVKDFLELRKPAWEDIFIDGLALRNGSTAPTFAPMINGIWGNSFAATGVDEAHGSIELSHSYFEGTDIDFHIHWMPATTNVGNVVWGVEWSIASAGSVYPASQTVTKTLAAGGVVNTQNVSTLFTIPGTGRKISDIICFRIFRDGSNGADTFTGSAFLIRVAVHIQVNSFGSDAEFTKALAQ